MSEPAGDIPYGSMFFPSTDDPLELAEFFIQAFMGEVGPLAVVAMELRERHDYRRCPRCNDGLPTCASFKLLPPEIAHRFACAPFKTAERLCADCARIVNAPLN